MDEEFDLATQEEAFASAKSEQRLAILRALQAAASEGEVPVAFSDLRERVDIDDPGKLGYHLRQLTGQFVEHTEDGYRIRNPGRNVVRATAAGSLVAFDRNDLDLPGDCPHCGSPVRGRYEDGYLSVRCRGCDHPLTVWSFPPRALAQREDASLARAFDAWVRHRIGLVARGVCPDCGGEATLAETTTEFGDEWLFDRLPMFRCGNCHARFLPSFGMLALDDDRVRAFYRKRDRPLEELLFWSLEPCVSDRPTTISTDPLDVTVEFEADGETLAVHLDSTLAVTGTERR